MGTASGAGTTSDSLPRGRASSLGGCNTRLLYNAENRVLRLSDVRSTAWSLPVGYVCDLLFACLSCDGKSNNQLCVMSGQDTIIFSLQKARVL